MKINNFKRLDDDQAPIFPDWKNRSIGQKAGDILGVIIGFFVWVGMLLVFLLTMYLYWFQKNLIVILQTFKPGHYHIPWWISLLTLIFLAPLTLIVIIIGTIIAGFQK